MELSESGLSDNSTISKKKYIISENALIIPIIRLENTNQTESENTSENIDTLKDNSHININ